MAKVIWTEPALTDLHEIIQHIGRDSKIYAERFGTKVTEAPRSLKEFPYSGRIIPEFIAEADMKGIAFFVIHYLDRLHIL